MVSSSHIRNALLARAAQGLETLRSRVQPGLARAERRARRIRRRCAARLRLARWCAVRLAETARRQAEDLVGCLAHAMLSVHELAGGRTGHAVPYLILTVFHLWRLWRKS